MVELEITPGPWIFSITPCMWPLWDVSRGSLIHLTWGPLNWSSSWIKPFPSRAPSEQVVLWPGPTPAGLLNGSCTTLYCLFLCVFPHALVCRPESYLHLHMLKCSLFLKATWSGNFSDVILLSCKPSSYTVPLCSFTCYRGWQSWVWETSPH